MKNQSIFEDTGEDVEATPAAPLTAAQVKAQQEGAAIGNLTNQILASSDPTQWQGEGYGSAQANARNMAEILSGIGITDVKQFGKVAVEVPDVGWVGGTEDGGYEPLGTTHTEYVWGNKATGQAVPNTYGERQTGSAWGGTYAGSGNTGYRVSLDAQGNPQFYTTGASSSDLQDIAPIISILSIVPSPLQPFAMAANAAIAASQGNVLGALASVAGIPGVSEALSSVPALSEVMSVAKTANQVQNTVKAIESGNVLGALSSAASLTGTGGTQIGDTGVNVSDALKYSNIAKAISNGDPNAIINAAISAAPLSSRTTDAPLTEEEELQRSLNRLQKSLGDTGYTPPEADVPIEQPETTSPEEQSPLSSVLQPSLEEIPPLSMPVEQPKQDEVLVSAPKPQVEEEQSPLSSVLRPSPEEPASLSLSAEQPKQNEVLVSAPRTQVEEEQSPLSSVSLTPAEEPLPPLAIASEEPKQDEVLVSAEKNQPEEELSPLPFIPEPEKTPEIVITSDRPEKQTEPVSTPSADSPPQDNTPEIVITDDRPERIEQPVTVDTIPPSDIPVDTTTPTTTPKVSVPKTTTPSTTTSGQTDSSGTGIGAPKFFDVKNPWLTIKGPTNKGGVQQEQLQQLYSDLTPELKSAFQSKMPMNEEMQESANGGSIYSSIDPDLLSILSMRANGYAEGGDVDPFALMQKTMDSVSPKFVKQSPSFLLPRGQNKGAQLQQLMQIKGLPRMGGLAQGGLPSKYAEAAPKNHNPEFITGITGYYAGGRGTGQSDDIPAMLHDGDYVIDAEAVSAFGDGSSKAGKGVLSHFMHQVPHKDGAEGKPVPAKIADGEFVLPASFVTALGGGDNRRGAALLDDMREKLRAHKRSAPTSKIPPKAKSPLDYLKGAKG